MIPCFGEFANSPFSKEQFKELTKGVLRLAKKPYRILHSDHRYLETYHYETFEEH